MACGMIAARRRERCGAVQAVDHARFCVERGEFVACSGRPVAATSVGAYGDAAPAALLLIAVSAPLVYALSARRAWELGAPG